MENEKDFNLNDEGLLRVVDIQGFLEQEAASKGLQVYLFPNDVVKQYHTPTRDDLGIMLLAKDNDCALYNLRNLRRCYPVKI